MLDKFNDKKLVQEILRAAKSGMWIIELEEGKLPRMYADDMMLSLLGLSCKPTPEECYRVWYDGIDENYYKAVELAVEKSAIEECIEVEYPWSHPNLGRIFIRCYGTLDKSFTKGIRIRGYHQNITDAMKLRSEREYLKELNDDMLSSLHKIFFAVYRINPVRDLISPLKTMEDIRYVIKEAPTYSSYLHHSIASMIHPDDRRKLLAELAPERLCELRQRKTDRFMTECRRLFGTEYRWVLLTVDISSPKTSGNWMIVTLQDIHEQKCSEEERNAMMSETYEAAQKANQAKSEFLSRMSHDIRTPMNAIIGMTTLAIAHIDERDRLMNCLDKIKMSTKLMTELVNEVLDMSKIESGSYEMNLCSFRLSALLHSVVSMAEPVIQEKEQSLSVNIGKLAHDYLIGDVMRIQQVLMNIVSNANKYTQCGGHISIKVEEIPYRTEQYGSFKFEIRDDGIGMTSEYIEHIFEPFSRAEDSRTSRISGTGLGMAIANNIVQLMGGTIQVESQPEIGSVFTIVLNLKLQDQEDTEEELPKADIAEVHLYGKTILLVEDNEINMGIAKEIFEMTGAAVETAENGKEALELFKRSEVYHFNAIFMDIQMPVMDGNEAAVAIRSLGRADAQRVPIIAMTANAFAEDVLLSRQSGMNEHIAKPIDMPELAAIMLKWL